MDTRLRNLIAEYQTSVRDAVALMIASGIPCPSSNTEWVATDIAQRGTLRNNVPYYKHGYGCTVSLPGGEVDFDFGSKGEVDGFDAWRLARYAEGRLSHFGYLSEDEVKGTFEAAVHAGELVYSGYILYYLRRHEA